MNGTELKIRIIRAGVPAWRVAQAAGISPARLSLICNNRLAPDFNEQQKIEGALSRLESERERRHGHE